MKMRETSRDRDKEPYDNNKVFLNKDRVSMPDVDSDFSPDIRDLVVEYCKKLYGLSSVANITTKGYIQPRGAIRNVTRIIGIERDQKEHYLAIADKVAKLIPMKPNMSFAICEDELREHFKPQPEDTEKIAEYKKEVNEVIDQAKLVEGVFLNYGMHAAGVIIADGNPIDDYVPLMRDEKSGDMKVQCDMVQAEEEHGLLKFDFLGLRNLKIVTMAIRSIKRRTGIEIDVEKIPFDDEYVYKNIFANAKTGCVFQFESSGMKQMLKRAKPDCLEDLIALVSLYRPGPMDFIPQYIENKMNPEKIKYDCPELKPILGKTYGCIVYQEQVMEIVQKLAGFSLSQADNVRRFMSKKKFDKLEHEREAFITGDETRNIDGCVKRGISKGIANKLFDQMVEFAKYAFNKSHAAAYAVLSYMTAYLKTYYPADYMSAVLNCTDDAKKMPAVLRDCREIGLKVLPPNINRSQLGFSVSNEGEILFGLDSVKGTRSAYAAAIIQERETNGDYVSFKDFLRRDVTDKSTAENLIKAGALDEFHSNRYAMLSIYEEGSAIVSKIKSKQSDVREMETVYEESKEDKKFQTKYKKAKEALEMNEKQLEILRIIDVPEDMKNRMSNEKEVLGNFVSAHPLDEYRVPEDLGCIPIDDLEQTKKKIEVMGIVQNLEIKRRKSDNKPIAFFDLEDKTGIVHVCCFTKAYEKFQETLAEDLIVKLIGRVNVETDEQSGETLIQLYMENINPIQPDLEEIIVFIRDMTDWNQKLEETRKAGYIEKEGHPLVIYDLLNGEFRKTRNYVNENILSDKRFETRM
jgi:DNA polymerase-3 subunit alpha